MVAAGLWCGNLTANAKVKQLKLHVNSVEEGQTVISGKTTPKAKVKVSRYKYTYAVGKATRKGNFRLYSRKAWMGNHSYKLTVSKKGYRTTTHFIRVKSVKKVELPVQRPIITQPIRTTSPTSNQSPVAPVNNVSNQQLIAPSKGVYMVNQPVQPAKNQFEVNSWKDPQNVSNNHVTTSSQDIQKKYEQEQQERERKEQEVTEKQNKLSAKRNSLREQESQLSKEVEQMKGTLDDAEDYNRDGVKSWEWMKSEKNKDISKVDVELQKDPDNQKLQYEKSQLTKELQRAQKVIDEMNKAHEVVGDNMIDYQHKIEDKENQIDNINNQIKEIDENLPKVTVSWGPSGYTRTVTSGSSVSSIKIS